MPAHFLQRERVREYIDIPSIAWPTIWIAFTCVLTELLLCVLHSKGYISTAFIFPLSTFNIFVAFTPLHEAVHGSIAQCVLTEKKNYTSVTVGINGAVCDDNKLHASMENRQNYDNCEYPEQKLKNTQYLPEVMERIKVSKRLNLCLHDKHDHSSESKYSDNYNGSRGPKLKQNRNNRFFYPSSLNMFDIYYTTRLSKKDCIKYSNASPMSRFTSICSLWLSSNYLNLPFGSRASFRILYWRNMCVKFHEKVLNLSKRIYSAVSITISKHIKKRRINYQVYLNKFINQFIGGLCATILCQCYLPFQYIHLRHHRYTNEAELDPDAWASEGPLYILPFKWFTIEAFYWYYYLLRINTRPTWEWVISIFNLAILYGSIYYLCQLGFTNTVLYAWILPGYLAKGILSYSFDYLPHRYDYDRHATSDISTTFLSKLSTQKKRKITRAENEYLTTSIVSMYKSQVSCLTIPFLYQNYHIIHHLAPYIPFYQYELIWNEVKEELLENGTQIIPILPNLD